MKKTLIITLLAALCGLVHADSRHADWIYGGLSAGVLFYEEDAPAGTSGDFDYTLSIVEGKLGIYLNEHFALEGRAATGISDDDKTISGINTQLELEYSFSGFLVGRYPLSDKLDVYGLAGFTHSSFEAEASANGVTAKVSEDGTDFSFGAGAEFDLSDRLTAQLEWTLRHNSFGSDDGSAHAATAGITFAF